MEALRLKREEEERKRQYDEQMMKEKLMGEVNNRYQPQQFIPINPPAVEHQISPVQNLYPISQVPSVSYETKAAAKYVNCAFNIEQPLYITHFSSSIIAEKCLILIAP